MMEELATVNLLPNNIIELRFLRENVTLDVSEMEDGWKKAEELSPDKTAMILLKTGRWTLIEPEARPYVINTLKSWPAVAIVIDNLGQRILGQFIINLTGKRSHLRLFNNEKEALQWLNKKAISTHKKANIKS